MIWQKKVRFLISHSGKSIRVFFFKSQCELNKEPIWQYCGFKNFVRLQLNKYETTSNCILLSQNLTSDCSLIFAFLSVFAWCDHKIVLQIKIKLFYEHIIQKLVKSGKYTKINKQSHVKFWLNWRKYRTVSDHIHLAVQFAPKFWLKFQLSFMTWLLWIQPPH